MSQTFRNALPDDEVKDILNQMGERAAFYVTVATKEGKVQFDVIARTDAGLEVAPKEFEDVDLSGAAKFDFLWDGTLYESEGTLMALPGQGYDLSVSGQIFRVQRRANFRTSLPKEWKKDIFIDQAEQNRMEMDGEILDISLGGCLFVTDYETPIISGQQVYGDFTIHEYDQIRFRAVVRRATQRLGDFAYGIEFIELEGNGTQTLNNITLKAARLTRDYSN